MKRIYHTWDKWECYPAGFYDNSPKGNAKRTKEELELSYAQFLADDEKFRQALEQVLLRWPNSCEHYLSNECMNRIAWLGQASACIYLGIPSAFRGGFHQLSEEQQKRANSTALEALNTWLRLRGEPELNEDAAQSKTEMNLY